MLIDCDRCAMRDLACDDCVVTVLLGGPPVSLSGARPGAGPGAPSGVPSGVVEMDEQERQALEVLADSGLVPRLRLVPLGPLGGLPGGPAGGSPTRRGVA